MVADLATAEEYQRDLCIWLLRYGVPQVHMGFNHFAKKASYACSDLGCSGNTYNAAIVIYLF
jgi:hypothetical protein